jgi:fumarate reductase subunit C
LTTEAHAASREYAWRMPVSWWTRNRHYLLYTVREFTALPLAIWLLWLLYDISQTRIVQPTAFGIFSIFCLPFAVYHSYTFLKLAGDILHFKVFDRPISSRLIVLSQFGAWVAASIVIGFLLVWFAR